MKLRIVMLGLAATLFAAMGGCANTKTNAEMDSLRSQNKELADQVATQNAQIDSLKTQVSSMTPSTQPEPTAPGMGGEGGVSDLTGGNIGVSPGTTGTRGRTPARGGTSAEARGVNGAGEVVIELPGDTLFDSGKATIKASAKKTLDNVAADIKKKYSGRMLRIEGYTDPTPVKSTGWDDNWDLGFVRARAVQKYLQSKGIPERDMYAASFGSTHLKSTKNYSLDRRVDIVVVENGR